MYPILVSKILITEKENLDFVLSTKGRIFTFLNPVSYLDAQQHKKLFEQFDGIWADGSLLVSAIRLRYGKNVTRRSYDMTSIAPVMLDYAEKNGKTIYIVASKQEDVEKAVNIFRKRNPKIEFAGYRNGYFSSEEEMSQEILRICELQPDFLIVGMGVVKQEKFLLRVKNAGYKGIGFTCGGFIHQIAKGDMDYYPRWINRMNLRFVYRMIREDYTRKRYAKAALLFPFRFIGESFFCKT